LRRFGAQNKDMAKKEKKLDEQIFLFAVKVTFFTSFAFITALGIDIARAARYIGSLYATNL
jgi:hypothetical protein